MSKRKIDSEKENWVYEVPKKFDALLKYADHCLALHSSSPCADWLNTAIVG